MDSSERFAFEDGPASFEAIQEFGPPGNPDSPYGFNHGYVQQERFLIFLHNYCNYKIIKALQNGNEIAITINSKNL